MGDWPYMPIPRLHNTIVNIPNKDNKGNQNGSYDIIYLGEKYNALLGDHITYVILIYRDHSVKSDIYTIDIVDNNTILTLDDKRYDIYFKSDEYNPVKYWEDIILP